MIPRFKVNEHMFDIMTVVNCHRTDAVRNEYIT